MLSYVYFLRVVFEWFDVHLSLIYKKILQHKTKGAKQGEFINNVSNIKKIFGGLFKGK